MSIGKSKNKEYSDWYINKTKKEITNELIEFYRDKFVKKAKRKLSDIWKWSDDDLEIKHDFIQWIFPIRTRSRFNPSAPVLDNETISIMVSDPIIIKNIRKSLDVMMAFYGWKINNTETDVIRLKKPMIWIKHTHNYDRISRILSSLNLLNLSYLSDLFFLAMCRTIKMDNNIENKYLTESFTKYWLPTRKNFLSYNIIKKYNISKMKKEE